MSGGCWRIKLRGHRRRSWSHVLPRSSLARCSASLGARLGHVEVQLARLQSSARRLPEVGREPFTEQEHAYVSTRSKSVAPLSGARQQQLVVGIHVLPLKRGIVLVESDDRLDGRDMTNGLALVHPEVLGTGVLVRPAAWPPSGTALEFSGISTEASCSSLRRSTPPRRTAPPFASRPRRTPSGASSRRAEKTSAATTSTTSSRVRSAAPIIPRTTKSCRRR